MNRLRVTTGFAAFLFALLALTSVAVHAAPVEITGALSQTDDGTFILLDRSSGETVTLKASAGVNLAEHVGTKVKLTGEWTKTDDGAYFSVTKVAPGS